MRRIEILRWLHNSTQKKSVEEIRSHLADLHLIDPDNVKASVRMVQREMSFLTDDYDEANEFDITWGPGNDDGRKTVYWIDPNAQVDFSFGHKPAELLLAFSLADKHLEQVLPRSSYESIKRYFDSVNALLMEEGPMQKEVRRLLDRVAVDQRGQRLANPMSLDLSILDTIYKAIRQNKQLNMTYRGRESRVHPAAIVIRSPKIYLVAKYQPDDIYRNLLVHRISTASVDFLDNQIPENFSLEDYLAEGGIDVPVEGDEAFYDIEIEISGIDETANLIDDLQESPIHTTQTLTKKTNQRYLLKLHSQRTYQLVEWIVARGRFVKVLKPDALREDIRSHLADSLKNYD